MKEQRAIPWRNYQAGNAPPQEWPGYEVQKPIRQPSVASDVIVPFLQAVITALVLGTGAATILWGFWNVRFGQAWYIASACGFVVSWLWRLGAVSETLWVIERALGTDITGDQVIGKPEEHDHIIIAGGGATTLTPIERKRAQFVEFVHGCEVDTSMRRWEPILGRERYAEFRDALLHGGLAEWIDPDELRQGWRLTRPAEEIIEAVF